MLPPHLALPLGELSNEVRLRGITGCSLFHPGGGIEFIRMELFHDAVPGIAVLLIGGGAEGVRIAAAADAVCGVPVVGHSLSVMHSFVSTRDRSRRIFEKKFWKKLSFEDSKNFLCHSRKKSREFFPSGKNF